MFPTRWFPLAVVLLIAACQAAPVTTPTPSPSAGGAVPSAAPASLAPTAGPTGAASVGHTSTTNETPEVIRELVLVSVYSDGGVTIEAAEVLVEASDPAFNRLIDARGGAYALRDVPVGTRLTL